MIYIFLADGFEEIEALGTMDILRRCGLEVQLLSINGKRVVNGAHGLEVKADSVFRKNFVLHADALVLPGGMGGTENLMKCSLLRNTLMHRAMAGTLISAICAAPLVLADADLLTGKHMTCYPGLQSRMRGCIYHPEAYVVEHGNIITAAGPAATPYFAFAVATRLAGQEVVNKVKNDMLYEGLPEEHHRVLRVSEVLPVQ